VKNEEGLSSPAGKSGKPDFKSLQAAILDKSVQVTVLRTSSQKDPDVLLEPAFRLLPGPSDRPEVQAWAGIEKMSSLSLNIQRA
jgi:hypothetical protein